MKRILLLICGLCLSSSVMATTVWAPTNPNDDINFLLTTTYTGTGILGLFDDSNLDFSASGIILDNSDSVSFAATGAGFTASNYNGDSTLLSDSYNFILGMSLDNGVSWIGDTFSIQLTSANGYQIFFGGVGQTLVADIQAVPLPAAFWLFSTAFLSLIGFSRRKKISV